MWKNKITQPYAKQFGGLFVDDNYAVNQIIFNFGKVTKSALN